ncbi:Tigger transposable element-derived protein 1 [Portunus trituberculatus]|uniref:Tigger transposable element-derived protein 1 n=1 Tax=Portunus trituberculatus TaxID=210409 RepID=A0A5B7DV01_PORTR|nr:Tigger transposable element-derived protein 1 [Portunus trituberculatus]
MELMLTIWIEDRNQKRMPVSQALIMDKTRSLWDAIKMEEEAELQPSTSGAQPSTSGPHRYEEFKASEGWFRQFKSHEFRWFF